MTQGTKDSKLKMHSPDLTQDNIGKLAELFPNCVTEARDEKGQLKQAIDFDQLRQELSYHIVEGPQERYRLNWPGKKEAQLVANSPIAKTFRPCRDESLDFDKTKNLFIEGDNLDALKLLQETYLNKVKIIYIDPPYNTGNNIIYKDNYYKNSKDYFFQSNQKDELNNYLVTNQEANGRFHSDWISMMYPRLKIARNLLKNDGVIFISIDDNELSQLKKICDEIFGESNFVANFIRVSSASQNVSNYVSVMHDYTLAYIKNKNMNTTNWKTYKNNYEEFEKRANSLFKRGLSQSEIEAELKELVKYPRFYEFDHYYYCDNNGVYQTVSAGGVQKGNTKSEVIHPKTEHKCRMPQGGWRYNEAKIREITEKKLWHFGNDHNTIPRVKLYLKDYLKQTPKGINFHDSQKDIRFLKQNGIPFDFPKPVDFLSKLIEMPNSEDEIILDFFSGSASTAHAVLDLNKKDKSNRRYIMVQFPEPCNKNIEIDYNNFSNVADIAKERIRKVSKMIKDEIDNNEEQLDLGFRVLKIDTSNMKSVYYTPDQVTQKDLFGQVDNIKKDRTDEDLLFQVLLDWGVDLTLPIQSESISGKKVYFVDQDALAACFEPNLDEEFVKMLAERKPLRVVFRDSSYGSDSTKINVEQIFKLISPNTDVKTI